MPERCFNVLMGGSFVGWSVAGIISHQSTYPSSVVIAIGIVQLIAGCLFAFRYPVARLRFDAGAVVATLAIVAAAILFGCAQGNWSPWNQAIFGVGALMAVAGLVRLGNQIAIFPVQRRVVTGGPYSLIRHPVYLGELIMVAACALAAPGWLSGLVLIILLGLMAGRIAFEERHMSRQAGYRDYIRRVRWRLIPGVW